MRTMMDINEIRHHNVRLLIRQLEDAEGRAGDRAGGPTMLAAKLGKSTAQVGHFASDHPIKAIGNQIAREIEEAMGLERGWMDWLHEAGEAATGRESRAVRLDADMIRQVALALDKRYKNAGGYNIVERPEEFAIAYELRVGMTDAYVSPKVFELVIQHADLTPQGASKDGRGSDHLPAGGPVGAAARAGTSGKA